MSTATTKTIPWWKPETGPEERDRVLAVLASNYLNDGDVTTEFERRMAAALGSRFGIGVTSGTTALFVSLAGVGVGHGDEVVVPDVTFIATANAVTLAGATPVFVDVDPATLTMSPAAFEAAITPRTRAVIPVHVSGRAAAIERIHRDRQRTRHRRDRRRGRGTAIEAQRPMPGHVWPDRMLFVFAKQDDHDRPGRADRHRRSSRCAVRLREVKDQGRPVRGTGGNDVHASIGFNFKLTNLQSAVGLAQLDRLESRVKQLGDSVSCLSRRARRRRTIDAVAVRRRSWRDAAVG